MPVRLGTQTSPPPVIRYLVAQGDLVLELNVDFSSGRPVVVGGFCNTDLASDKVEGGKAGDCDFQVRTGPGLMKGTFVNPKQKTPLRQLEIIFDGGKLVLDEKFD